MNRNGMVGRIIMLGVVVMLGALTAQAIEMPTTGLRLWLEADAITGLNDGDPVATWLDSSTNGSNMAKGDPVGPTWKTNILNGKPVVRFDGITNYLASGTFNPGGNDITLFIVARTNGANTGGYQNIFIGGVQTYGATGNYNFWQLYVDSGGILQANFYTPATLKINTGIKPSATSFQILGLTKSNNTPGSSAVLTNGTVVGTGTGTVTLATIGKCYLGSWNKNEMNGDIAEVVFFNTLLGTTDRQLVEGLLAWKYGLQGSLPSGHPWESINPEHVPTIENATPGLVGSTSATLVGNVLSGAFPMTVSVFWGDSDGGHPTNNLWNYTNTFTWASGSAPSTNVALPTPNISYFYRFYATNAYGDSYALETTSLFASDQFSWVQAETGTHYWTNAANWSPAVVPNAQGVIAVFTNERAGIQTINVGQAITLGQLIVGNTNAITITKQTGGAFLFDSSAANPRITCTNAAFSTDVPVTYGGGSGLEITNTATVSLQGALGGFSNLVKQGTGTLQIYGNNTFTGSAIIEKGVVTDGNGTPPAGNIIPNNAWVEVANAAEFKMSKNNEAILGARGIGEIYVSNSGRIVIGTNTADSATYTTRLTSGGSLRPGFDAETGDLYLNFVSAGKAQIRGGDIYLDLTTNGHDRIMFKYSENTISAGNLHMNFVAPYVPTNGTFWDVFNNASGGGTIVDGTPDDPLFTSIDSTPVMPNTRFDAEILTSNKVRVTLVVLPRGSMVILR